MLLTMFVAQLPILLVSLVGCIVTWGRWNETQSRAAGWALLGFGIALVLCVFMPVGQTLVQNWVVGGHLVAQRAWAFTVAGLFWSIVRAVSYACLLMAVLAGAQRSEG